MLLSVLITLNPACQIVGSETKPHFFPDNEYIAQAHEMVWPQAGRKRSVTLAEPLGSEEPPKRQEVNPQMTQIDTDEEIKKSVAICAICG